MGFEYDRKLKHYIAVAAFCVFFYVIVWTFIFRGADKRVEAFIINGERNGLVFDRSVPVVRGFPGPPKVIFSGDIIYNGITIIVPEFKMSGYFLGGTTTKISFPYGFAIAEPFDPALFSVDRLNISIETPSSFPNKMMAKDLSEWRRKVGIININSMRIDKGTLRVNADGHIGLDTNLQPTMKLETKTRGYEDFIALLQRYRLINQQEAALASLSLNGLAKEDPISRDKVLEMPVTLESRKLFLGPLQVGRLPVLRWDTRNSPAQRQR
ncbi:MAG: DUF2125 domain-containing protein [Pseudomonadota bacterium]